MLWTHLKFSAGRKPAHRLPKRQLRQLAIEQLEARDVPSVNVLSYHNDNASSGDNLSETTLRRTAGGTIAQGHGTAATAIRVELPFIGHLSLLIYLCKGTNGSGRKSHYEKTPT